MLTRNPVPVPQHDSGNCYQQMWLPCTQHETINHYLSRLRFPTSFRGLCEQWRSLGKPHLVNLRYPEGLHYGANSGVPQNLEVLSSLQEIMTLSIFAGYMRENIVPTPRPFREIASHMHIYCSIKVELAHRMYQFTKEQQDSAYERQWRALQEDFHHDRAFCQSLFRHDCIGYLLYGEVYHLNRETISQRYQQFQMSSSRNLFQFLPLDLTITNPPTSQQDGIRRPSAPAPMPMTNSPAPITPSSTSNNNMSPIYSNQISNNNSRTQSPMQTRTLNAVPLHPAPSYHANSYSDDSSISPQVGTPTIPLSIHQGFMNSPSLWQQQQQQDSSSEDRSREASFFRQGILDEVDRNGTSIGSTSTNSVQFLHAVTSSSSLNNNDSRAEQNRQKSKRHYERKKLQRSLLYDLIVKMESTMQYLIDHNRGHLPVCQAMHEALSTPLPTPDFLQQTSPADQDPTQQQIVSSTSTSSSLLRQNPANEKKKLNKKVQNHLEMQRMVQISQTARILHPNTFGQSSINVPIDATQEGSISDINDPRRIMSTSTQILLSQTQEEVESIHKSVIFEPQDAFLLNWLHVRSHWDELVAAENRLSRNEDKPIARLITYLTAASTASNASGPSSANLNPNLNLNLNPVQVPNQNRFQLERYPQ